MLDPALFIKVVWYREEGCCNTLESYLDGNEVFEFITLGEGRTMLSDELSQFVDCDGPVKYEDGRGLMGTGADFTLTKTGFSILPFALILTGNFLIGLLISSSSTYVSSSSSELDSILRRLRFLLRGQQGVSSKFIFASISEALKSLSFCIILFIVRTYSSRAQHIPLALYKSVGLHTKHFHFSSASIFFLIESAKFRFIHL